MTTFGGTCAPGARLAVHAVRTSPPWGGTLIVLVGAASLIPLALAISSGRVVAALASAEVVDAGRHAGLLPIIATVGVLFFCQQALAPVLLVIAERVGRAIDRDVRVRVIDALARPETLTVLETAEVRGLVEDINGGLGSANMRDALTGLVNISVVRWGSLVGVLLFLPYRWWLAPLVAGAYLIAMVLTSRVYQVGLRSSEGDPASGRRARYIQALPASSSAAKDVRIFGLTDWLRAARHTEWLRGVQQDRCDRSGVRRVSIVSGAVVLVSQLLLLLTIYSDFRAGSLSEGSLAALLIVVVGMGTALSLSSEMVSVSVGAAKIAAAARLERVLGQDDPQPRDCHALPVASPEPVPTFQQSMVFEEVWFTYPGSSVPVLRGLSFEMKAGSSTALVGVNGAGKSTVVKLMAGLYRPDAGRILVDGVDLATVDGRSWQRQCAILSQSWIRWGISVRDNVLWGAPNAEPTEAGLAAAARASALEAIVAQLPRGWDTLLSRQFDGVELSGGQWQRVALARALYAQAHGAHLLAMDEPTAALDVRGEAEINANLLGAATEYTLLLVSHRFASVRLAAHIMVMEDGRLLEEGDHESLMRAEGLYARMFATQAKRYLDGTQAIDH
jgi:ABC-type multidrug transport system fused ATPase/permease subunit